jgi:ADP-heptose:LPS heptosyltransferase
MPKNKIIHAKQINLREVSAVMIVAPYAVEDFILATPAIAALKEALPPEGRLIAVVSPRVKELARNTRAIDRVITAGGPGAALAMLFCRHQVLVNFDPDHFSSIVASMLSGAKAKVAYALKKEEKIHNMLHNLKLHTIDAPEHKTIKYLNLVRFIGANSYDFAHKITIPDADRKYALDFLKKNQITQEEVLIGMHPTSRDEAKRWSINKYHQLVRNLVEKYNARVFVYSHADEKERLEEFMHVIRNKAIVVDTHDYMKLAALSSYLACFICNESDFMHLLAPFTNLIVIWGPTDPETNKPAGANHEVIRAQDGSADSVPVSRVTEQVNKFLVPANS